MQTKRKLLEYFPLLKTEKTAKITSKRAVSEEETINLLNSCKEHAGITRTANITYLDNTEIPIYQTIRPLAEDAEGTFTVFSGRGLTELQSEIGAVAEGIERYCAEYQNCDPNRILLSSINNIEKRKELLVYPKEFNLNPHEEINKNEEIEWVTGINLLSGDNIWVPANAVFYPYKSKNAKAFMRYFTTGLGFGNNYHEAIIHALCEVIERDAAALNLILRDKPCVDTSTIKSQWVQSFIEKMKKISVDVIIRNITTKDINIPVFSVLLDDQELKHSMFISGGYGCHLEKEVALISALNEAASSRIGTISGAREDLKKIKDGKLDNYYKFKEKYHYWFNKNENISFDEINETINKSLTDDLLLLLNHISKVGFDNIIVVDLSQKDKFPFPVVKLLVPGIERYSYKINHFGKRARNSFEQLYGKPLKARK
jgi:putative methanogenesis marker protein 1